MAEEDKKTGGAIRMNAIDSIVADIQYKSQILARTNKIDSGIMDSGIPGFAAGLIISLLLIVVPVLVLM
ncbi:tetrahydromethanopterin S-methyltransferase subunit F [Methanofollis formosanus]|uniref:Tetrahydromethanopterin S-methyltransferase subunit F n=1 Tax=Methanofollis formosanus TaxID=299308 RepID=A0A8G1A2A0_9EURY|nr:tetrahydromethanopterin S-methyltransferase subunit F [Methanofollis formosanus]QYZ79059.1 tetrahydromethanopterin S-methyltransferase subunit F [Methanofollis formosanus]